MSHFRNASNFTDLKFSGNNTDQKRLWNEQYMCKLQPWL